ncbi:hypothetical protein [Streptomyces sp. NPDC059761]|uniref:hypothetical protein n=1 Tax=Streptomyces sp. NPDC059761 TaxID=3346937 RepID=UPI0036619EB2
MTANNTAATERPTPAYIEPVSYAEPTTPGVFDINCASRMGDNRKGQADVTGRVLAVGDTVIETGGLGVWPQFRQEVIAGTMAGTVVGFEEGWADDYRTYESVVVQWQTRVRRSLTSGHVLTTEGFRGTHRGERLRVVTPETADAVAAAEYAEAAAALDAAEAARAAGETA